MKNTFLLSIFIFCSFYLSSAQRITQANVIFVIDEELALGSISNVRLTRSNGEKLEMGYYPGKLFFETDKSNQFDFKSDSLFLAFDYNVYLKNKHVVYNYKFLASEFWLKQDY
ncbi:MAG: hypothetical protein DI539_23880, partial [Flavobacterium psychrophilum]